MFDQGKFHEDFNKLGYSIVENVLTPDFIQKAKFQLEKAIKDEVAYHKTKQHPDFGMVLLCSLYGGAFIELFDNPKFTDPFDMVLGKGSIVYAYTSSSMPPKQTNYSSRIHVDCPRIVPGYVTNMGATVLLDDFTEENGATWFMPGSQGRTDTPSPDEFYANSKRLLANAGAVCFFNARVWHAGGTNTTDKWRHAITVNMCRAYMKQRIDVPRAMSHMDLSDVSDKALQKLGFFAQVPSSYDEYYVEPSKRKFKQQID